MQITCPDCGNSFETDAHSGEVACPHCGEAMRAEAFGPTRELPPARAAPETAEIPHDGPVDSEANIPLFPRSERYKPLGELGRGGMGVVYKAHDSKLNRVVALKVLIAGEGASDEEVKRFFQEATSAARLRHPNIIPIHELDVKEGRHYFTMDFVEGGPLSKLIAERKITPRRAVEILRDVAKAGQHAHVQGIIHRDLKPSNIIITPDGRPMVMDFGLAKQVESDKKLTRSGVAMGTPEYMAPEQARGETKAADARTDVWALGAVLYEMVTGLPPFVGATSFDIVSKVVNDDPIPPRTYDHACPRDVETIALRCLEKDPRRRYQTAGELAEDCRRFLAGEPITARPASLIYRARKRLARHRGIAAMTVAVVTGLVFLAALYWSRPGQVDFAIEPADAKVTVDGVECALEDGRLVLDLPAGKHLLEILHEEYAPVGEDFLVGRMETTRRQVNLRSLFGVFQISADQPGALLTLSRLDGSTAEATIGGKATQVTEVAIPTTLELRAGGYSASVQKPGFECPEFEVNVPDGRKLTTKEVHLEDARAKVTVACRQSQVQVTFESLETPEDVARALVYLSDRARMGFEIAEPVTGNRDIIGPFSLPIEADSPEMLPAGAYLVRYFTPTDEWWDRWELLQVRPRQEARLGVELDRRIIWRFETKGRIRSGPALADLNADAVPDCIIGSYDRNVYAISGANGRHLWTFKAGGGISSNPAMADLDGDGVLDCILTSGGNVHALSGRDGHKLWSSEAGGWGMGGAALADLDNDGTPDCVVGSGDRSRGAVNAFSGKDGSKIWRFEIGGFVVSSPALADLDGDDVPDCIVGSYDKTIYALSGKRGRLLWSFQTRGEVWSSAALLDADDDGVSDCIIGSNDNNIYALSGKTGQKLWSVTTGCWVRSKPAVADLNRDGIADCVVYSYDSKVYALSGKDGQSLWVYDTGFGKPHVMDIGGPDASPALADLDADGVPDCVVGTEKGGVFALSGRDGNLLWRSHAKSTVKSSPALADITGDGVADCVFATRDEGIVYAVAGRGGRMLWTLDAGARIADAPSLAHLDNDGVPDCVIATGQGRALAVSGKTGRALWEHKANTRVRFNRASVDLNGDGVIDCLAADERKLHALSGRDGRLLWDSDRIGSAHPPSWADVNGDDVPDCVLSHWEKATSFSGVDGRQIWTFEIDECRGGGSIPAVADINGDGSLECVVGGDNGNVYALRAADGQELWRFRTKRWVRSGPVLGDLDDDGLPDCVVGSGDENVYALSGKNGRKLWSYHAGSRVFCDPVLADLDGDETPDCLVGTSNGCLHAISGRDGRGLWRFSALADGEYDVAVADLDRDGVPDCLVSTNDRHVYALSGVDGRELWHFWTKGEVCTCAAVADLDGDGRPEVIVGSSSGMLYVLRGDGWILRDGPTPIWSLGHKANLDQIGRSRMPPAVCKPYEVLWPKPLPNEPPPPAELQKRRKTWEARWGKGAPGREAQTHKGEQF